MGGLPRERARVTVVEAGVPVLSRTLTLSGRTTDLGDLVVVAGLDLTVRITDEHGVPVASAGVSSLQAPGRSTETTNAEGEARLSAVRPGDRYSITAEGHLGRWWVVPAELEDDPVEIEIRRSHSVVGRVLTDDFVSGDIALHAKASKHWQIPLGTEGEFRAEIEPYERLRLRAASAQSAELRLEIEGRPGGELTDLGELTVSAGKAATGWLIGEEDGAPISGARIWTPRPSVPPALAALLDNLVETTSGDDGAFRLTGLDRLVGDLRFEATGYSTKTLRLPLVETEQEDLDLGEVTMGRGALIVVESDVEGGTARLTCDKTISSLDFREVPLSDGEASFPHSCSGKVKIGVLDNEVLRCERSTVVAPSEEHRVRCDGSDNRLWGLVLVNGRPEGPGQISWRRSQPDAPETQESFVLNTDFQGLVRTDLLGGAGMPVTTDVDVAGNFETEGLLAGSWMASFQPQGHSSALEPVSVLVTEAADTRLILRFDGLSVSGRVVDRDGAAIDRALVEELLSGVVATTAATGTFSLLVPTDDLYLRARKKGVYSEVLVTSRDDAVEQGVTLVIDPTSRTDVSVSVARLSGQPESGALVLAEDRRGNILLATADRNGLARFSIPPPAPEAVRIAAWGNGAWGFSEWIHPDDIRNEPLPVLLDGTGAVELRSRSRGGPVTLTDEAGRPVSELLSRIGLVPYLRSDDSLRISGLPRGRYTVSVAGGERLRNLLGRLLLLHDTPDDHFPGMGRRFGVSM